MRKLLYLIAIGAILITSCDDHLSTKNLFNKSTDNFYRTPTDIDEAMAGVYNALFVQTNTGLADEHIAASMFSDLVFAGGGADDAFAHNAASFADPAEDTYHPLWLETYRGVFRANSIIAALESEDAGFSEYFASEQDAETYLDNALGEAYFMRGFLMFRAARFFGGMPLILAPDADRFVPRSSFSETFSQIASDFHKGATLMAEVDVNTISVNRYGHGNRWTAKAYLARTFLHYTGYMTNIENQPTTQITLPDGTVITRNDVVEHLEDVIDNSGYALVSDFRNLWPYSHINQSAGETVLPWAENEGLQWAGQDGPNSNIGTGNTEVMFAKRYAFADWSNTKYRNWAVLFFSVRGQDVGPYGQGWGWGTVNPNFYNNWSNDDPRKRGSVLDLNANDEGVEAYNPDANNGVQQTELVNKKYIQLRHDGEEGVKGMFYYIYRPGSTSDSYMLWSAQDFYYLRFSDVLLMHSELSETADGLNAVRARAGLEPVSYSLEALKVERKHEFAFEGIRWFDLVRWGDVENSGNNYFSQAAPVINNGVEAVHSVSYRPETKGLVPIPESEIRLSDGLYTQNPGW
ncbi:RagB/SusD family nutrient uptake outer membrane protein [Natronoflexus pectinivorans]|uniref:Putative outer membrane starch-binding protein n=1 Tax=Natronoflexus pectinivorans TaxID=682526 RepID=A0A4V2RWA2_9BACT|nr:RagB/SusD family nutrient uptake outer membrane protein [Natronoflexus pectinivorans]TCO07455.1 putative outer membrane starch-binding protein [Natronoflexus pectinivorans]